MSPRPKKPRTCCPDRTPCRLVFKPAETPMDELEQVSLNVDELEALRLCDGEGLSQLDAGLRMGISRGTVQRMVTSGRRKIIGVLLRGQALVVQSKDGDEAGSQVKGQLETGHA